MSVQIDTIRTEGSIRDRPGYGFWSSEYLKSLRELSESICDLYRSDPAWFIPPPYVEDAIAWCCAVKEVSNLTGDRLPPDMENLSK